jgi:hypothetical protein
MSENRVGFWKWLAEKIVKAPFNISKNSRDLYKDFKNDPFSQLLLSFFMLAMTIAYAPLLWDSITFWIFVPMVSGVLIMLHAYYLIEDC